MTNKKERDFVTELSTPKKLCKRCYNWLTKEDVGEHDIPHCLEDHYETYKYLSGDSDNCEKFCEL